MRIIVIEDNELYKNELLQCLEQEESDIEIVGSASNCLLYTSDAADD